MSGEDHATDVLIEANDLRKSYEEAAESDGQARRVEALRGVSFRVPRGESVAIVGRSGSGKSTLLHLLGTLDVPSSGSLKLAGVDVARLSDKERTKLRRNQIGFVFQFFNLLPTLSAVENVMMPAVLAGRRSREAERLATARLEQVGLSHRMRHHPYQMSGGEMQRTAIARALVLDPPLLLADEPTGNLDSDTGHSILELLIGVAAAGRTVMLVTHDPGVAGCLDRVIGVRDGRIDFDRATVSEAPSDPPSVEAEHRA